MRLLPLIAAAAVLALAAAGLWLSMTASEPPAQVQAPSPPGPEPQESPLVAEVAAPARPDAAPLPVRSDTTVAAPDSPPSPAPVFTAEEEYLCMKEGIMNIKSYFVAHAAHFAEKDSYLDDPRTIGFEPEGCPDGSRPAVPDPSYAASCCWVFHTELVPRPDNTFVSDHGISPEGGTAIVHALGKVPAVRGRRLQINLSDRRMGAMEMERGMPYEVDAEGTIIASRFRATPPGAP